MLEEIFQIGMKRFFEKVAVGNIPGAGVNSLPPVPGFTMAPNSGLEPPDSTVKPTKVKTIDFGGSTGSKTVKGLTNPANIPSLPKLK